MPETALFGQIELLRIILHVVATPLIAAGYKRMISAGLLISIAAACSTAPEDIGSVETLRPILKEPLNNPA